MVRVGFWDRYRKKTELARDYERAARLISLKAPSTNERLDRQEFIDIGASYGVPASHLAAVTRTEARGKSYNADARLKILYEPHVFHRVTKGKYAGRTVKIQWGDKILDFKFSYRNWKRLTYKQANDPNYFHVYKLNQQERWALLVKLYEIEPKALEACSWGAWQILGENWRSLGYASAWDMVETLYKGEAENFGAFIRFCRKNNVLTALRKGQWLKFGKGYRGRSVGVSYVRKLKVAAKNYQQAWGVA